MMVKRKLENTSPYYVKFYADMPKLQSARRNYVHFRAYEMHICMFEVTCSEISVVHR